jgi:NAD(P)-dependent dehydrogenase (short-subunit alcohol dehydrogenase family)
MGRLESKVALVTGAGQGIGRAIAQVFAAEGARLVITELVPARLEEAVGDLTGRGATVVGCLGDAANKADAERAVQAAIDAYGRLDVLVNNAQSTRNGVKIEDIDESLLKLTFGSGFLGTLNHMQAAFPHLKQSQGSIINFASREGLWPEGGLGCYAANKEAIRGLTRAAAREWGEHGVRVNAISPGALTPSGVAYFEENPALAEALRKELLLKRFGDAEADVAPAALFLATDDSRYLTGQTLNVNGGLTMF